jgi:hypothetical protein
VRSSPTCSWLSHIGSQLERRYRNLRETPLRTYGPPLADLRRLVLHYESELNPSASISSRRECHGTCPATNHGGTMGNNGVVSIRLKALGVSITSADGSVAIEQTSIGNPAASVTPKAERFVASSRQALPKSPEIPVQASPTGTARPTSARQSPARPAQPATEPLPPLPEERDSTVRENSDAGSAAIDEVEQTPLRPSGRNGPGPQERRSPYRQLLEGQLAKPKRPGLAKQNRYGAMKRSGQSCTAARRSWTPCRGAGSIPGASSPAMARGCDGLRRGRKSPTRRRSLYRISRRFRQSPAASARGTRAQDFVAGERRLPSGMSRRG